MKKIEVLSANSEMFLWEISKVANHFHVNCLDRQSGLVGSGFSIDEETAKKKAYSELNERHLYSQLAKDTTKEKDWGLDFDNSCSGFAVGYSRTKVIVRAICEAVERWALSNWIDEGLPLAMPGSQNFSDVGRQISKLFLTCSIYRTQVIFPVDDKVLLIQIAVVLAWTETGVFAGYGTKLDFDEALDHAFVEALRNYLIYKNQKSKEMFPYNRIKFFAENKLFAKNSIPDGQECKLPTPSIKLFKAEQFEELWLARVVLNGWTPWQIGSESRFLY